MLNCIGSYCIGDSEGGVNGKDYPLAGFGGAESVVSEPSRGTCGSAFYNIGCVIADVFSAVGSFVDNLLSVYSGRAVGIFSGV